MDDDRQLLRQFTQHNSQEAFAALTARYLSLVYSTCRREIDDADLAEDVTQAVFLILARKAPSLGRNVVLSGWLFQTARFAAKNARLTAQRRAAYEQKAAEALMEQQMEAEDEQWSEIEPLLNQSLAALKAGERECVLLRFFQGASFAEVGASLGLSEDAARKRITRSLGKMRQFFTRNGVIVPALALPILLTAHAAKAAPAACQANVASFLPSVLAGHTTAALTGSHAYQVSEGTLKAMKLVQLKVAAGITAAVLGVSTYAVTRGIAHPMAKSGHIYQQGPNETLTAAQIAQHCRTAYTALSSYQIDARVNAQAVTTADPKPQKYMTSAKIKFVRPGKISAEGTDMSGTPFAYVSDGTRTEATFGGNRNWKTEQNPETAIASATGIAQSAATTVPAILLGTNWGMPLPLTVSNKLTDPLVHENSIDGHLCYVLTAHLVSTNGSLTQSLWIDQKTFLLRSCVSDSDSKEQTFVVAGQSHVVPATKSHNVEMFTNERLNPPIPDSTFTLPAVQ